MKFLAFFLAALWTISAPASAQTSEVMDGIIATPAISVSQASYLVFVASGKLTEDATPEKAYDLFQSLGWFKNATDANRALKSSEYAYLLARSFGLRAGFLETFLPGPRYAYRDLVSQGLFSAQDDPDEPVSGVEAVRILSAVMDSLPAGAGS